MLDWPFHRYNVKWPCGTSEVDYKKQHQHQQNDDLAVATVVLAKASWTASPAFSLPIMGTSSTQVNAGGNGQWGKRPHDTPVSDSSAVELRDVRVGGLVEAVLRRIAPRRRISATSNLFLVP